MKDFMSLLVKSHFLFFLFVFFSFIKLSYADLTVVSLNTLHLGQDSSKVPNYIPSKYAYIKQNVVDKGDVTLLQEVMAKADLSQIIPTNFTSFPNVISNTDLKGRSPTRGRGYVEAYATIVDPVEVEVVCRISYTNSPGTPFAGLIRPPDALLIKAKGLKSRPYIWLINLHAIWGRTVGGRVNELNTVIDFSTTVLAQEKPSNLQSDCGISGNNPVKNIIVAGDFNLTQKQIYFHWKKNNYDQDWTVEVNAETTINTSGNYSSNYDHFIISNSLAKNRSLILDASRLPTKSTQHNIHSEKDYRLRVSDHVGVKLTISD